MESDLFAIRRGLLRWWRKSGREFWWRRVRDPYTIAIVEVLLKQTNASASYGRIQKVVRRYPSAEALSKASLAKLEGELQPLGLHRQRATQLRNLGAALVDRNEIVPRKTSELLKLPGVGPYAASAIRCFAFGSREPVIDVNVVRIVHRLFGITEHRGELRRSKQIQAAATDLVAGRKARELNWALLDLGALVCTSRKPRCSVCPLLPHCSYGAERTQLS